MSLDTTLGPRFLSQAIRELLKETKLIEVTLTPETKGDECSIFHYVEDPDRGAPRLLFSVEIVKNALTTTIKVRKGEGITAIDLRDFLNSLDERYADLSISLL